MTYRQKIKEAAAEFGRISKHGGWWLAFLVAASVEKGKGGPRTVSTGTVTKVTAREFAEMSGTSAARVLRHLDAWEKAAADGLVPPAEKTRLDRYDLLPDDMPEWSDYYTAVKGGYNGGTDRQPTAKQAAAVLSQLPPDDALHVIADAVESEEIRDALREDEETQDRILDAALPSTIGKGEKPKVKRNRSMDEMLVTLELIGVLGKIRELARTDADSPLIIECKNLMRETLEILDGLAEADDPESVEKMLDDFGDFLAAHQ